MAGLVIARQQPPTAKGIVFITLEDETGRIQTIIHPELWNRLKPVLKSGVLILTGILQVVPMPSGRVWKCFQVRMAQALDFSAPVGMAGNLGAVAAKR